ncbi:heavy metal translocating P-type ATPase [Paenibacillus ginsengihumi]|uniref:heavy metal translocating P-type ATPase n=1 Tax=Paenibacillus ginsengihumi TaxID=431596 RepID=UPI000362D3C3|nr:heavy metal translocating P-type ATPase [Paenibacillus ginsengihumi]
MKPKSSSRSDGAETGPLPPHGDGECGCGHEHAHGPQHEAAKPHTPHGDGECDCGHEHAHGPQHEAAKPHAPHGDGECDCGHEHAHGPQHEAAKPHAPHDDGECGCGHDHGEAEREIAAGSHSFASGRADGAAAFKSVFRIDGMDCADCAMKLQKRIGALPAVQQAVVNYGAAKMTVLHSGIADSAIIQAVRQAGYTAVPEKGAAAASSEEARFWRKNRKALSTLVSGALFAIGWLLSFAQLIPQPMADALYAAAMIAGGYRIAWTGLHGLKSRTIGMDFLMTVAAVGAALIGEWEEGAAVVFLFSLGETLEALTMDRTRRSIRGLMELSPKEATVRRDNRELTLSVDRIEIGDMMLIKPGSKIAMDGIVTSGTSAVNQAPITGESVPVEKQPGDEVFAGTVNGHGALEVQVTRRSEDNTLSRIIHLVEEAQAQKAPSQRFVDVFAQYYTPAVLVVAVGIAVIPVLFLGQPFDVWFYRALMMLVVSCPCALVISTPVAIVAAIGNAAKNGVLIKGGAYLERLGAVSVVAFDKTGTLTRGVPELTELRSFGSRTEEEVLAVAAAIEKRSEHPIAQAIVRRAEERAVPLPAVSEFTSVAGRGAKAVVHGTELYIGSPKWFLEQLGTPMSDALETIRRLEREGRTVVVLGTAAELYAVFAVSDEVRAESAELLRQLSRAGIARTVMLTGDNRGTAAAVAAKLGGIEHRAELLPQHKVAAVKELMASHGQVVMVGDGVNDAPALATATVGIAMGAAGTDTALETADVALMADDLGKLPYAIRLSRKALRIIKQNIAFSLLVKAVFLLLIFAGYSTLWMAVLADTGSSLLVIANGMRLLKERASADSDRSTSAIGG